MIDSVRAIYENDKQLILNGSLEDPFIDGLYGLTADQINDIKRVGSVCTEQQLSVTISDNE